MNAETMVGPESTFLDECVEHLNSVESLLLGGSLDAEGLNSLFRSFHSIKGAAEVFGHSQVGKFTHGIESVLVRVRDGEIPLNDEMSRVLLECGDHVRRLLSAGPGEAASNADLAHETARLSDAILALGGKQADSPQKSAAVVTESAAPSVNGKRAYRVSMMCNPELFAHALDPLPVLRFLAQHGALRNVKCITDQIPGSEDFQPEKAYLGFVFDYETENPQILEDAFEFIREDCAIDIQTAASNGHRPDFIPSVTESVEESQPAAAGEINGSVIQQPASAPANHADHSAVPASSKTFRVEADKLDGLVDLVGELVTSGAEIGEIAGFLKSEMLSEAGHRLSRTITEIRERTLRLRMVPLDVVFSRLRRAVHDTAQALHKKVHFATHGGEIEFDRTLVERVTDPLMHIVRNAVDHAIESEFDRIAAGKNPEGRLTVSAYNRGGDVVLEIQDDGRGLSRERILARAVSKGLVAHGHMPTDEEIYSFIFYPGFSTAETVTQISGRGVGLDVVRRNIESIGGNVQVSTKAGEGSIFTVRLPLTLATIDGFMVGLGDVKYVIPMDIVKECIKFVGGSERDFVKLREEVVPFADLRKLLGFPTRQAAYLVIVEVDKERIGLVVDKIFGETQTVVKPLGLLRNQTRGLSGFSVLGSGAVAPILDVPAVCALAKEREQIKLNEGIGK